jgi:hypothetical protein
MCNLSHSSMGNKSMAHLRIIRTYVKMYEIRLPAFNQMLAPHVHVPPSTQSDV